VGPNLAKQIPVPQTLESRYDNLMERNPSSIFLTAVDEEEIIDIVKGCKPSTDHDGIDIKIIQKVIEGIARPLTIICNL